MRWSHAFVKHAFVKHAVVKHAVVMAVLMFLPVAGCQRSSADGAADAAGRGPPPGARPGAAATAGASASGTAAVPDPEPPLVALDARCPGGVRLHVAPGGPVELDGQRVSPRASTASYYEATDEAAGLVVSVMRNPDGSSAVSYTSSDGTHGACDVAG